jgi:hypothetical protein
MDIEFAADRLLIGAIGYGGRVPDALAPEADGHCTSAFWRHDAHTTYQSPDLSSRLWR